MFTITTTIVLLVHVICEAVMAAAFRIPQHNILSPASSYHRRQQQQQRTIVCNVSIGDVDYYSNLLSTFKGDFDNYDQVIQDRLHGLKPREGGGHEHIHCTLVPCPQQHNNHQGQQQQSQWVLAAFYFNGNPQKIFRFRMYQLVQPISNELPVRMKLNTLLPHVERQLRECSEKPCIWWKELWKIWFKENSIDIQQQTDVKEWNKLQVEGIPSMVSSLKGCDVLWEPNWEPSKHTYLYNKEYDDDAITDIPLPTGGDSYHATIEAGQKGAIVDSISLIPGKRILIKDELSLWNNEFWINDRGYDPDDDDMPFVYGNQRGVPYKLQKVSNFITSHANIDIELELQRELVNSDLEWTLGEKYRTKELFQQKMQPLDQ